MIIPLTAEIRTQPALRDVKRADYSPHPTPCQVAIASQGAVLFAVPALRRYFIQTAYLSESPAPVTDTLPLRVPSAAAWHRLGKLAGHDVEEE
jgi:hypothetical protein